MAGKLVTVVGSMLGGDVPMGGISSVVPHFLPTQTAPTEVFQPGRSTLWATSLIQRPLNQ